MKTPLSVARNPKHVPISPKGGRNNDPLVLLPASGGGLCYPIRFIEMRINQFIKFRGEF